MTHIRAISQKPRIAQGNLSALEQIILFVLQGFFSDWDNYPAVAQNLQKFYSKTP